MISKGSSHEPAAPQRCLIWGQLCQGCKFIAASAAAHHVASARVAALRAAQSWAAQHLQS